MYVGHIGLALGLRAAPNAPSLWLLVLAAQGPDWVDAALIVTGRLPPDLARGGHGWLPVAAGGAAVALIAAGSAVARRRRAGLAAAVAAAAYLSHWPADVVTGLKPTWPGGPVVGFGLYRHQLADLAIESAVIAAGWWLWRRSLPTGARPGALDWALLAVLLGLQLAADFVMAGGVLLM